MKTANNTVLITGGSSGIGYALAVMFVKAGSRVIITGRDKARLEHIRQQHPQMEIFQADLRDVEGMARLAAAYPEVNVLVNNAGVQFNYNFIDSNASTDRVETEIDTNFTGHVLLTQAFLPGLLRHPSAAVINVTSTLGIIPKQNASVYCASKAAMHSFTQTLRWQLEGTAIKVFEVLPPVVDTPMTAGRAVSKVSPESVAQEVLKGFARDHFEMWIGKTKALRVLYRLSPVLAARFMRGI